MRIDSIENILDEYNFHAVQKAMEALEWYWGVEEDGLVPLGEIRSKARDVLERAYRYEDCACITIGICGGFEATRRMEVGDLTKYLSLKFVIAEGNNYE